MQKLYSSKVESLYQAGLLVVGVFRQPIAGLLGTSFLPWTNKVSTCRKALLISSAVSYITFASIPSAVSVHNMENWFENARHYPYEDNDLAQDMTFG